MIGIRGWKKGLAAILAIGVLSACSLFGGPKEEPRNGILLLGEKAALEQVAEQHRNAVTASEMYPVKRAESEEKQILVMSRTTADSVVKTGILRKSDNNDDVWSSDPITSLPDAEAGQALLFGHPTMKDVKRLNVGVQEISLKYGSNSWIGHVRNTAYAELILVFDDAAYAQLSIPETQMALLHLKQAYGETKDGWMDPPPDRVLANTEWLKLTKDMKTRVDHLEGVTIITQNQE
ncbi:lipoprotein BA_5634 family protein [Paenibacillus dendritiformis]|uniref:lipoprotein BA_5634 family protein n=1 Tax=Paenibacillus dendritiformis TaxID=130049 RepID=UPI00387E0874